MLKSNVRPARVVSLTTPNERPTRSVRPQRASPSTSSGGEPGAGQAAEAEHEPFEGRQVLDQEREAAVPRERQMFPFGKHAEREGGDATHDRQQNVSTLDEHAAAQSQQGSRKYCCIN